MKINLLLFSRREPVTVFSIVANPDIIYKHFEGFWGGGGGVDLRGHWVGGGIHPR